MVSRWNSTNSLNGLINRAAPWRRDKADLFSVSEQTSPTGPVWVSKVAQIREAETPTQRSSVFFSPTQNDFQSRRLYFFIHLHTQIEKEKDRYVIIKETKLHHSTTLIPFFFLSGTGMFLGGSYASRPSQGKNSVCYLVIFLWTFHLTSGWRCCLSRWPVMRYRNEQYGSFKFLKPNFRDFSKITLTSRRGIPATPNCTSRRLLSDKTALSFHPARFGKKNSSWLGCGGVHTFKCSKTIIYWLRLEEQCNAGEQAHQNLSRDLGLSCILQSYPTSIFTFLQKDENTKSWWQFVFTAEINDNVHSPSGKRKKKRRFFQWGIIGNAEAWDRAFVVKSGHLSGHLFLLKDHRRPTPAIQ